MQKINPVIIETSLREQAKAIKQFNVPKLTSELMIVAADLIVEQQKEIKRLNQLREFEIDDGK